MNFFKKQAKQIDVESVKKQLSNSPDLVNRTVTVGNKTIELYFLMILVNRISIEKNILSFLNNSTSEEINLNYLFEHLPITEVKELVETNDISKYILDGFAFIYLPFEKKDYSLVLVILLKGHLEKRKLNLLFMVLNYLLRNYYPQILKY
ncbi:MAG TPA: spore germination protein [Bacillaceae bacterium]|nr:spore germination protein [Paenibacillus bovis]HLU23998.1 spore germination protein [Bacillaceae bacterium]